MQIMLEINVDKLFMLPAAFVGTLKAREREKGKEKEETALQCTAGDTTSKLAEKYLEIC